MKLNILNPNPGVKKKYDAENLSYLYNYSPADRNEAHFFAVTGANNLNETTLTVNHGGALLKIPTVVEGEIKREIFQIYRVVRFRNEYITYTESLRGKDYLGNTVSHHRKVGEYQDVVFEYDIDPATKKRSAKDVSERPLVYTIPLADKFVDPSTGKETTIAEFAEFLSENCQFYAKFSDRTFTIDLPYLDFITMPADELLEYAKSGKPKLVKAKTSK